MKYTSLNATTPRTDLCRGAEYAARRAATRVTVSSGRIEVHCASAKDAVGRLFALAQAITNDYERFEAVVGGGGESA